MFTQKTKTLCRDVQPSYFDFERRYHNPVAA